MAKETIGEETKRLTSCDYLADVRIGIDNLSRQLGRTAEAPSEDIVCIITALMATKDKVISLQRHLNCV